VCVCVCVCVCARRRAGVWRSPVTAALATFATVAVVSAARSDIANSPCIYIDVFNIRYTASTSAVESCCPKCGAKRRPLSRRDGEVAGEVERAGTRDTVVARHHAQ
jgi:hypothetical protein